MNAQPRVVLLKKTPAGFEDVGIMPLQTVWSQIDSEWWPMWLTTQDNMLFPLCANTTTHPAHVAVHRRKGMPLLVAIPLTEFSVGDLRNLRKCMASMAPPPPSSPPSVSLVGHDAIPSVAKLDAAVASQLPLAVDEQQQQVQEQKKKRNTVIKPGQFTFKDKPAIQHIIEFLLDSDDNARFFHGDIVKAMKERNVNESAVKHALSTYSKPAINRPVPLITYDKQMYSIPAHDRERVRQYLYDTHVPRVTARSQPQPPQLLEKQQQPPPASRLSPPAPLPARPPNAPSPFSALKQSITELVSDNNNNNKNNKAVPPSQQSSPPKPVEQSKQPLVLQASSTFSSSFTSSPGVSSAVDKQIDAEERQRQVQAKLAQLKAAGGTLPHNSPRNKAPSSIASTKNSAS